MNNNKHIHDFIDVIINGLKKASIAMNAPIALWIRDDDLTKVTNMLWQFHDILHCHNAPCVFAAIPTNMDVDGIKHFLKHHPQYRLMQHGINHDNNAPGHLKKCEIYASSEHEQDALHKALIDKKIMMEAQFEDIFLPYLVPPWNRVSVDIALSLNELNFKGLSCFGQSHLGSMDDNSIDFHVHNTHIDIIDWSIKRRINEMHLPSLEIVQKWMDDWYEYVVMGVQESVLGILTHHLVHGDDQNAFLHGFLSKIQSQSFVKWYDINNG